MDVIDPHALIDAVGFIGIIAVVFAESGLLFGFFLPGDSLLFTAGLLVAQHKLDVPFPLLASGCFIAAVAGDQVGYAFGRRVGPALFRRPDSRFFKQEYVERSQAFFQEHGVKTIVLARFIPVVRTFAPIVAGVGRMEYRTFVIYNVVGGLLWGVGVTTLGYTLGRAFPELERYLLPIIVVIVGLSVLPVALEWLKNRRAARGPPSS